MAGLGPNLSHNAGAAASPATAGAVVSRAVTSAASLMAAGLCLLLAACATSAPSNTEETQRMREAAVLAYESGEASRAETLYQGLSRATPNDPEPWFRLGNLYARADRPEEAAVAYQKVLQLNPQDVRAWYNLGVVRQRQAYALFLRANALAEKNDPIHERSENMLHRLEPEPANEPAKAN